MSAIAWWGWLVAVAAGSVGALLRTALVRAFAEHTFPVGVLVANVMASAVGGAVVARKGSLDAVWVFVLIGGFCGGLSTLSTLASDTTELWMEGERGVAVRNVVANVALGLFAAWAAYAVVS